MKSSLKSYSSIISALFKGVYGLIFFFGYLDVPVLKAQVANYINNGSFEDYYNCNPTYPLIKVKYWLSIDSSTYGGGFFSTCNGLVAFAGNYQYARTGKAYVGTTIYFPNFGRGYMKNRLKQNLQAGKVYCVKFHVNIRNDSPRGMDGFGIYLGNNSIDTITKCDIPLSYINPQVKNPIGNVITDTLNWVPITGTFTANGTEKYALIGNFLADAAVTTTPLPYSSFFPAYWTDVLFDDVSCIELNVPAFAGPDKSCIPGDSVFIGRQPDYAIDPGCIWYQLPNLIPIDTVSGLWVKPIVTTTYVVRQELECSPLKWDTVVIYSIPDGLKELNILNESIKVYPVPARDEINLSFTMSNTAEQFKKIFIYNNLGQLVREEEISFKNRTAIVKTDDLTNGVYVLQLRSSSVGSEQSSSLQRVSKRFVVAH